jgi:hypothetical protein
MEYLVSGIYILIIFSFKYAFFLPHMKKKTVGGDEKNQCFACI